MTTMPMCGCGVPIGDCEEPGGPAHLRDLRETAPAAESAFVKCGSCGVLCVPRQDGTCPKCHGAASNSCNQKQQTLVTVDREAAGGMPMTALEGDVKAAIRKAELLPSGSGLFAVNVMEYLWKQLCEQRDEARRLRTLLRLKEREVSPPLDPEGVIAELQRELAETRKQRDEARRLREELDYAMKHGNIWHQRAEQAEQEAARYKAELQSARAAIRDVPEPSIHGDDWAWRKWREQHAPAITAAGKEG